MTREELEGMRREAQEIIINVTRDLRQQKIALWQWWDVTTNALGNAYMAEILYRDEAKWKHTTSK